MRFPLKEAFFCLPFTLALPASALASASPGKSYCEQALSGSDDEAALDELPSFHLVSSSRETAPVETLYLNDWKNWKIEDVQKRHLSSFRFSYKSKFASRVYDGAAKAPQQLIRLEDLASRSRLLVLNLKRLSKSAEYRSRASRGVKTVEVGAFEVQLKSGRRIESIATSFEQHQISRGAFKESLYSIIHAPELKGEPIERVNFYHTHPGWYPLSAGDEHVLTDLYLELTLRERALKRLNREAIVDDLEREFRSAFRKASTERDRSLPLFMTDKELEALLEPFLARGRELLKQGFDFEGPETRIFAIADLENTPVLFQEGLQIPYSWLPNARPEDPIWNLSP